jgi:hypothetical protein
MLTRRGRAAQPVERMRLISADERSMALASRRHRRAQIQQLL